MLWNYTVAMAAQISEYNKNYWRVHFNLVNFLLHEVYLNFKMLLIF